MMNILNNWISGRLYNICFSFFYIRFFFHAYWRFTGQQGKGGDLRLFHCITSTHSRTFRRLFAALHVRWLPSIFNRNPRAYQTVNRWGLPAYWITIWLIDDAVFVCLPDDLILGFLLQQFDTGNRWIWVRIDYHPCIISKPNESSSLY